MAGNTKKIVIDASIALSKLLPDEKLSKKTENIFTAFKKKQIDFIAPDLLKYEVSNSLRSAVVQKRLTKKTANKLLLAFLNLPIFYKEINFEKTLSISLEKNLSFYDASYVYLAKSEKVKLETLDKKLSKTL